MNKKQLIVWVVIFCLSVTPAFAKNKIFIVRQRLHSVNRTHLTSGGQFTKLSANFDRPSFAIRSNTGEFSRNSFSIASKSRGRR